ncbi:phage tail tape measure protein [Demequina silvatica]|uniref:phage tail tape measure protein n=1 Tax=Demequina silvatica TaxID=1638988 RepID=UPI000785AEC1|nr:phage tail tape measure protein [Demequina silvatica]
MTLRVAELESLFTANITPFEQGAQRVEARQKALDGSSVDIAVNADGASALRTMDQVESTARSLPDSDITVTADTTQAEGALNSLENDADKAGRSAGDAAGSGLSAGIVGALATIPIAGAVALAGKAVADGLVQAFQDGLAVEVRSDRLAATSGLDPVTVGRLGRAAGEAYADNWGASIEENFDTARIAVQTSLLDPDATKRDAQTIISDLAGISDLIGEETSRIARSSAQLIKTGVAANADEAFDIIVKGQQAGLNVSEDWLDTLDEYSTKFRDLGLTGPQTLGLLRQAIAAGARDTDTAADALKEFAIRAIDGSDTTRHGFEALGLSVRDMRDDIAGGGDAAASALDVTLDRLRAIEDPAKRDAIAVELFGTKAEDMGDALYAMDLSNAVKQLGDVEGAASDALATLTDNDQNAIDTAVRNIELAADGIKGALAGAFSPQIEGAANFVTENREAVVGFLLDVANGALDMGRAIVDGIATGGEAVGDFVAGPLADLVDGIAGALDGFDRLPGDQQLSGSIEGLRETADAMRGADEAAAAAGATIREKLITNGLDVAQRKLNDFGDGLLADAALHDRTFALAKDIDAVGIAADGAKEKASALFTDAGKVNTKTDAGQALAEQLDGIAAGMEAQAEASLKAGEGADEAAESLEEMRGNLVDQLEALGLTTKEAENLADAYGLIPEDVVTKVTLDNYAETYEQLAAIAEQVKAIDPAVHVAMGQGGSGGLVVGRAAGAIDVHRMALGGVLSPIAQTVAPGTMRVVGDRLDVEEAFIPLDGSPRSIAILLETIRRMPNFRGMADGGIHGQPTIIPQSVTHQRDSRIHVEHFHGTIDDFEREMQAREDSTGGRRN